MVESARAQTIRAYAAAFGTCDIDTILGCASDDVVWEFNGSTAGEGKTAFEAQMRHDLASGSARVTIEQLVEQGDTVVALNRGRFVPNDGGDGMSFVSAEAYTVTNGTISFMRTYQPLGAP